MSASQLVVFAFLLAATSSGTLASRDAMIANAGEARARHLAVAASEAQPTAGPRVLLGPSSAGTGSPSADNGWVTITGADGKGVRCRRDDKICISLAPCHGSHGTRLCGRKLQSKPRQARQLAQGGVAAELASTSVAVVGKRRELSGAPAPYAHTGGGFYRPKSDVQYGYSAKKGASSASGHKLEGAANGAPGSTTSAGFRLGAGV